MIIGTIKWFNATKGFGFIQPEQGGADVFVHISALQESGINDLHEGEKISYELINNKGRTAACNLKKINN